VVELESFAQVAVVTKDPILGAVVAQRLGALNKADRELSTVSREQLADLLVGDEVRKVNNATRRRETGARHLRGEPLTKLTFPSGRRAP
jgi:hypothetical protein